MEISKTEWKLNGIINGRGFLFSAEEFVRMEFRDDRVCQFGITFGSRHVNLSVLCLTYRSPRVCLVCLFWALKR
jgi:hypothetical protein